MKRDSGAEDEGKPEEASRTRRKSRSKTRMINRQVRTMSPKQLDLMSMSTQLLLIDVGRYSGQECVCHMPLGFFLLHEAFCLSNNFFAC